MIKASEIVDDVKATLDADADVKSALGVLPSDSKVFIRNTVPEQASYPFVLISDALLQPAEGFGSRDPIKNFNIVSFDVTVYAKNRADGSEDRGKIYSIAMAVDNALHGASGTLTTCKYLDTLLLRADAIEETATAGRKLLAYVCKGLAI